MEEITNYESEEDDQSLLPEDMMLATLISSNTMFIPSNDDGEEENIEEVTNDAQPNDNELLALSSSSSSNNKAPVDIDEKYFSFIPSNDDAEENIEEVTNDVQPKDNTENLFLCSFIPSEKVTNDAQPKDNTESFLLWLKQAVSWEIEFRKLSDANNGCSSKDTNVLRNKYSFLYKTSRKYQVGIKIKEVENEVLRQMKLDNPYLTLPDIYEMIEGIKNDEEENLAEKEDNLYENAQNEESIDGTEQKQSKEIGEESDGKLQEPDEKPADIKQKEIEKYLDLNWLNKYCLLEDVVIFTSPRTRQTITIKGIVGDQVLIGDFQENTPLNIVSHEALKKHLLNGGFEKSGEAIDDLFDVDVVEEPETKKRKTGSTKTNKSGKRR